MPYKFFLPLFVLFLLFPVYFIQAQPDLSQKLSGHILLQVEQNGEAWYVHPEDQKRHFMGRPADAFELMRNLGTGITTEDLDRIPVGGLDDLTGEDSDEDGLPDKLENALGTDPNQKDTDNDGYNDKEELKGNYNPNGSGKLNINQDFAQKQAGKILLQVENNGESWYINPGNNERYYLGRPADAFNIMRDLGLGISGDNLDKIGIQTINNNDIDAKGNPNKTDKVGDINLEVRIPKEEYQVGESLSNSSYFFQYNGEPFDGLFLFYKTTEGLAEGTCNFWGKEITSNGSYNLENWGFLENEKLECDGRYIYSIAVYSEEEIDSVLEGEKFQIGEKCEAVWKRVSPLKVASKMITVNCPNESDCCENWAYRCGPFNKCQEGYRCVEDRSCIKNEADLTEEIVERVEYAMENEWPEEDIFESLLSRGYTKKEIENAIKIAK